MLISFFINYVYIWTDRVIASEQKQLSDISKGTSLLDRLNVVYIVLCLCNRSVSLVLPGAMWQMMSE